VQTAVPSTRHQNRPNAVPNFSLPSLQLLLSIPGPLPPTLTPLLLYRLDILREQSEQCTAATGSAMTSFYGSSTTDGIIAAWIRVWSATDRATPFAPATEDLHPMAHPSMVQPPCLPVELQRRHARGLAHHMWVPNRMHLLGLSTKQLSFSTPMQPRKTQPSRKSRSSPPWRAKILSAGPFDLESPLTKGSRYGYQSELDAKVLLGTSKMFILTLFVERAS